MDASFWQRLHGGSTHLPIVLVLVSVVIDFIASRARDEAFKRALHGTGFGLAIAGLLGGCAAVTSGLVMTQGHALGTGPEKMHHLFVWPAFSLVVILVTWRFFQRRKMSQKSFVIYLVGMGVASGLMLAAGYWGGEMLLGEGGPQIVPASAAENAILVEQGHELFLKHCAKCHGDDALGTDDGPSLAGLKVSNAHINSVVRNGIKDEMPRFGKKLRPEDVQLLIHFLRTVK